MISTFGLKIVGSLLGGASVVFWRMRKTNKELYETKIRLSEEVCTQFAQILYLHSMLERHGIEPTEFDLIALNRRIER